MRTRTTTALITAGLFLALAACGSGDGKPLAESAAVMCEGFVKQRLKSPGTAKFPGVMDGDYAKTTVLSDTKPWKYKVTGVVDSQNGFGATVRSSWTCTTSTEDDNTWTAHEVKLVQR
ncbi:hypothetical protein ABZ778_31450 [Streptomyces bacillaris]|uniref:hypothetical protein n=1 Tax=Streptomyces bacillaris TaxID=68179 RepID=UPI0034604B79